MSEEKVYLIIEEAIELFEEAFDEDKPFKSTVVYEGCHITAYGKDNSYELIFDCKDASSEYKFSDVAEELTLELIFYEIFSELE